MATAPDTVVPNSLNYSDIKPQAIENKIQLCRYQPTALVTGAKGGDMIKFLLSGNGCIDPYSTYFQFVVEVNDLAKDELRWLDRSAHSFISRMIIRSQGVEIERIENYDVIAAMINDMLYSPEQCTQHYWEAFPTHTWDGNTGIQEANLELVVKDTIGKGFRLYEVQGRSIELFSTVKYPKGDDAGKIRDASTHLNERDELFRWLCQGASPSTYGYIGETCFHDIPAQDNTQGTFEVFYPSIWTKPDTPYENPVDTGHKEYLPTDFNYLPDWQYYQDLNNGGGVYGLDALSGSAQWGIDTIGIDTATGQASQNNILYPVQFAFHAGGRRVPASVIKFGEKSIRPRGTKVMQFMMPIYSGLIGLLMPEKKLLPLNLLPLDIEIVFNPHALYSSQSGGKRTFQIREFYIYANTLFFEQEIHRTLEAQVADHGLFLYCNSFHSAPVQLIATQSIPSALYISMNLKSINSVHWVFLYNHFDTIPCARKLHFVSHNISRMQLLNGTQLIPQYAVTGGAIDAIDGMGSSYQGQQLQFVVELYKAWNKLHDPVRDGSHHAYNTCGDQYCGQFDPLIDYGANDKLWTLGADPKNHERLGFADLQSTLSSCVQIANKQGLVGRCQYGISLEGEELGSDKTMITGRKSQYPFQIQLYSRGKTSARPSYMLPFLRADFIVYIRPDLQIVTLGK